MAEKKPEPKIVTKPTYKTATDGRAQRHIQSMVAKMRKAGH